MRTARMPVMFPDSRKQVRELEPIDEISGSLKISDNNKLMKTVLQADREEIDKGKLINDAINQGIGSFNPDTMFRDLVNNYQTAEQTYGESLIRLVAEYDPNHIRKNINLPEFRRILRERMRRKAAELADEGLVDGSGAITRKGYDLAAIALYMQELSAVIPKGLEGERLHKRRFHYGDKQDIKPFRKDRYRDIALKSSVKRALRRGHSRLAVDDLAVFQRKARGRIHIIYAIDASGSMKGKKIGVAKRAGVALAYAAIQEKDNVGLIIFGSEVKAIVQPSQDFAAIVRELSQARAGRQTDFVEMLEKAVELFPRDQATKHLVVLSDALPTIGEQPEQETMRAAGMARAANITISIIGMSLDSRGEALARRIVEIGQGRLYLCKDSAALDAIILEDYYSVR
ncbi:MAG TPA: VWA domain-containing protein [Candidatus Nanoarchaeia archaeon]|nr:VWA domain-containing protein [Candidatus Nanoarchaeia archaeon]